MLEKTQGETMSNEIGRAEFDKWVATFSDPMSDAYQDTGMDEAFLAGFQRGKESSEAYIDPNCTWACMCGKRSKNHENALDEVLKAAEQHLKDIGEPSPYAPVFDLEKIKEIITTLRKDRK